MSAQRDRGSEMPSFSLPVFFSYGAKLRFTDMPFLPADKSVLIYNKWQDLFTTGLLTYCLCWTGFVLCSLIYVTRVTGILLISNMQVHCCRLTVTLFSVPFSRPHCAIRLNVFD